MTPSTIDFSAQFGGEDAADEVLPLFRALKAASRGILLHGFPVAELTFVLRVDGEVNQYGLSGPGYLDFDADGNYISVDIGVTRSDREALLDEPRNGVIVDALDSSARLLLDSRNERLAGTDYDALRKALRLLVDRYRQELN